LTSVKLQPSLLVRYEIDATHGELTIIFMSVFSSFGSDDPLCGAFRR